MSCSTGERKRAMPRTPKSNRAAFDDAAEQEYTAQLAILESGKVRKRPDRQIQTEAGTNNRYLSHNLKLMRLEPLTVADPAETIEARIYEYFQICADDDMRPTISGLSLALGIDRRRLWEINVGKSSHGKDTAAVIRRAYQLITAEIEGMMFSGQCNPIPAIFMLKNHAGFVDRQEIELSANQSEDIETPEEIEAKLQKYIDAMPEPLPGELEEREKLWGDYT